MINTIDIKHLGICRFENFWGEELFSYDIMHYVGDSLGLSADKMIMSTNYNLANGQVNENALSFNYYLGNPLYLDHWIVVIRTKSGLTYSSGSGKRCSIEKADGGQVTIGVNGESKRMYISYPSSGTCSTSMSLI